MGMARLDTFKNIKRPAINLTSFLNFSPPSLLLYRNTLNFPIEYMNPYAQAIGSDRFGRLFLVLLIKI